MPECLCRGKNPLCLECGGNSWIGGNFIPELVLQGGRRICPFCNSPIGNLLSHVSTKHREKWEKFSSSLNILLELKATGLIRCNTCTALIKDLDKHLLKCHSKA